MKLKKKLNKKKKRGQLGFPTCFSLTCKTCDLNHKTEITSWKEN